MVTSRWLILDDAVSLSLGPAVFRSLCNLDPKDSCKLRCWTLRWRGIAHWSMNYTYKGHIKCRISYLLPKNGILLCENPKCFNCKFVKQWCKRLWILLWYDNMKRKRWGWSFGGRRLRKSRHSSSDWGHVSVIFKKYRR